MKKFWIRTLGLAAVIAASGLAAYASLNLYEQDRLDEGAHHEYSVRCQPGDKYMVMSVASQGGVDFDLTVTDPSGEKIMQSDSTDENTDWIRFTANKEGWYKIKILAYKGSGWYELILLNTDDY